MMANASTDTDFAFAGAAALLGQVLWYARAQAYRLDSGPWETQSKETKDAYVLRAAELLRTLRPAPRGSSPYFDLALRLSREQAARVVGRITPDAPFGYDPRD